jgi:DNA-binding cell septation regulator SpoVG
VTAIKIPPVKDYASVRFDEAVSMVMPLRVSQSNAGLFVMLSLERERERERDISERALDNYISGFSSS